VHHTELRFKEDSAPASAAGGAEGGNSTNGTKLIAGFNPKEISFPMTACNNLIGLDGELLENWEKLRKSQPAHLTINMWVLNIFAEPNKPETLIRSFDVANVDLKFE
jgi:hypothetical protein